FHSRLLPQPLEVATRHFGSSYCWAYWSCHWHFQVFAPKMLCGSQRHHRLPPRLSSIGSKPQPPPLLPPAPPVPPLPPEPPDPPVPPVPPSPPSSGEPSAT